jgi:2'-5' RNA ligase
MPYAIELYFDPETELALRNFRTALARGGIRPVLDEMGDRPHISLALIADDLDESKMAAALRGFAETFRSFPIALKSVDSFPGGEGIMFLAPSIVATLLAVHAAIHQILIGERLKSHEHYLRENWIPHCTIAQGVEPQLMAATVESAKRMFQPINGNLREIGMVFYRPVRPICSFGLRSTAI